MLKRNRGMGKIAMGVAAGSVLGATVGYMMTNKAQMNRIKQTAVKKCGSFFSGMLGI